MKENKSLLKKLLLALSVITVFSLIMPIVGAADSDPVSDASSILSGVLGPYALMPIDPMFNLFILSLLSILSGGGVIINAGITDAIQSNPLFSSNTVCWVMLVLCALVGIAALVMKFIPAVSAASQATLEKVIDYGGLVVRCVPYIILFFPVASAAGALASTAPVGVLDGFIAIAVGLASVVQYMIIKLARGFFDQLATISPEPFTTAVLEVAKKLLVIFLWITATFAPVLLVAFNIIIFLISSVISRRAFLFSGYYNEIFIRGILHIVLGWFKKGNLTEYGLIHEKTPGYIENAHPDMKAALLVYPRKRLEKRFFKRIPKYARCWLVLEDGNAYIYARSLFFPGKRRINMSDYAGTAELTRRKTRITLTFDEKKRSRHITLDMSRRYDSICPQIRDMFGFTDGNARLDAEKIVRDAERSARARQRKEDSDKFKQAFDEKRKAFAEKFLKKHPEAKPDETMSLPD